MGRVATSLAGVMGAAALIAVPVSISAAAPTATFLVAATPSPSGTVAGGSDTNKESYWVAYLEALGYENVVCTKDDDPDDPYTVPEADEGRVYILAVVKGGSGDDANELYWNVEAGDVLNHATAGISHVILCTIEEETSTPTPSVTTTTPTPTVTTTTPTPTVTTTTPTPTVTTTTPTPTVTTTTSTPTVTTTTPTSTTPVSTPTTPVPTNTGPPVETDRPVTSSSAGLLGAAALVAAGIAAMLFARRRQGDHR